MPLLPVLGERLFFSAEFAGERLFTQVELKLAAELQVAVWLTEEMAREEVQRLEAQVHRGAKAEPGDYWFDDKLQMVRSGQKGLIGVLASPALYP